MADKFTSLNQNLYQYLAAHRTENDPVLAELAAETEGLGAVSMMQIAPDQGAFITLLARAIHAKSALEVGTFTGYSAICLARGLCPGGRLLCCDVSEEWTGIARRYWQRANVSARIDLRLGPALDTLRTLPREACFDIAFVDADKQNYRNYYEEILARLRPNGLVLFDNVLWMGQVADPTDRDPNTVAMRELNDFIARDERVDAVMLAVADGLTLVRKRQPGETV